MLYLGSQEKGFYITNVATCNGFTPEFSGEATHIKQHINIALATTHKFIIIYLDQYIDSAEIIVESINQLKAASNAEIIIDSCGFSEKSELVIALKSDGYNKFVSAVSLGRKANELETAINPLNPHNIADSQHDTEPNIDLNFLENQQKFFPTSPPIQNTENTSFAHIQPSTTSFKSIAIAGCCQRIGTTTQAIQIAKYFQFKGYKTCYIEANTNNFIQILPDVYEKVVQDTVKGLIKCKSLDMFYALNNINHLSSYDYCIFDFGEYGNSNFQELAYIDKSIKIIVGGTAPNEIKAMTSTLQSTLNDNITYIFSFTDKGEQHDICKLMAHKSSVTFFANYTPQAFNLSSDNIKLYDSIFTMEENKKTSRNILNFLSRG